jgi:Ca2+-binding RTX toxin-like protein
LQIIGTDGKDIINVKLVDGGSDGGSDGAPDDPQIKVVASFNVRGGSDGGSDDDLDRGSDGGADILFFDPAEVQSIRIVLCDGDDHVNVGSGGSDGDDDDDGGADLTIPMLIEGDAGNDHLTGGGGNDTLIGGTGDDKLIGRGGDDLLLGADGKDDLNGGSGNDILDGGAGDDKLKGDKGLDILIGGLGKDNLKGGNDDDILIGALVTLDLARIEDVRSIWTNGDSYENRVDAVTTSLLVANDTVVDDGVKDTVKGDKGRDFFFAKLGGSDKDNVKDKKGNEELLPLS